MAEVFAGGLITASETLMRVFSRARAPTGCGRYGEMKRRQFVADGAVSDKCFIAGLSLLQWSRGTACNGEHVAPCWSRIRDADEECVSTPDPYNDRASGQRQTTIRFAFP